MSNYEPGWKCKCCGTVGPIEKHYGPFSVYKCLDCSDVTNCCPNCGNTNPAKFKSVAVKEISVGVWWDPGAWGKTKWIDSSHHGKINDTDNDETHE